MNIGDVISAVDLVLLDFDGPVTILLPNDGSNTVVAEAARSTLRGNGVELPRELTNVSDHLAILKFAATLPPSILEMVEQTCLLGEMEAAERSTETPGATDALLAFQRARREVIIVSNNRTEAVAAYLRRAGLSDLVSSIVGRIPNHPELMKPNPRLVRDAIALSAPPITDAGRCVLIGDSLTDIEVGRVAGARTIGFAKSASRGRALAKAGADAVTRSMHEVAAATLDVVTQ